MNEARCSDLARLRAASAAAAKAADPLHHSKPLPLDPIAKSTGGLGHSCGCGGAMADGMDSRERARASAIQQDPLNHSKPVQDCAWDGGHSRASRSRARTRLGVNVDGSVDIDSGEVGEPAHGEMLLEDPWGHSKQQLRDYQWDGGRSDMYRTRDHTRLGVNVDGPLDMDAGSFDSDVDEGVLEDPWK